MARSGLARRIRCPLPVETERSASFRGVVNRVSGYSPAGPAGVPTGGTPTSRIWSTRGWAHNATVAQRARGAVAFDGTSASRPRGIHVAAQRSWGLLNPGVQPGPGTQVEDAFEYPPSEIARGGARRSRPAGEAAVRARERDSSPHGRQTPPSKVFSGVLRTCSEQRYGSDFGTRTPRSFGTAKRARRCAGAEGVVFGVCPGCPTCWS